MESTVPPTIHDFASLYGWTVTQWNVSGSGPLSDHDFVIGGGLLIGIVPGLLEEACSLSWLDGEGRLCHAFDLAFDSGLSSLSGKDVTVRFGKKFVPCDWVIVTMAGSTITGILKAPGSDGSSGTFAATANPVPPSTGYS